MIMTGKTKEELDNESLENAKREYYSKIEPALKDRFAKGMPFKYGSKDTIHIQAKDRDVSNITGLALKAEQGKIPLPYRFIPYENTSYFFETIEEFTEMTDQFAMWLAQQTYSARDAKDSILSAETIEEIESIYNNYIGMV